MMQSMDKDDSEIGAGEAALPEAPAEESVDSTFPEVPPPPPAACDARIPPAAGGSGGTGENGENESSEAGEDEPGEKGEAEESGEPEDSEETEEAEGEEEGEGGDVPAGPALPLASVVEAVLFAAREPLKPAQIARAAGKGTRQDAVRAAVDELNVQYLESGRAFEIAEVSGRLQLMSRPEYVDHIRRIYPKNETEKKTGPGKLTQSALETLSIIAYKQPVTRGEIEHIRGVACGPALKTLMERGTVRVAGKKTDTLGQPLMYGTTDAFLVEFGLGSLDELPLRGEFMQAMGGAEPEDAGREET